MLVIGVDGFGAAVPQGKGGCLLPGVSKAVNIDKLLAVTLFDDVVVMVGADGVG